MARNTREIYDSLIAEKENLTELSGLQPTPDSSQTFLQDLTSTSKVSVWRLMLWVVAFGIFVLETLFDRHKQEIEDLKFVLITGTDRWYQQKALEFQLGSVLVWNGSQYVYPEILEDQKIIQRAAVVVSGGIVRVKVAKLNGVTPIPLTPSELVSFMAYFDNIVFSGVNYITITSEPDDLIISYNLYYNPLVMSPTGESLTEAGVFPAEEAISNYLKSLPFNGKLNLTSLTDAIQQAVGVVDPVLQFAQARYGANPFQPITDNYISFAGHMTIESTAPLNTTINYIESN